MTQLQGWLIIGLLVLLACALVALAAATTNLAATVAGRSPMNGGKSNEKRSGIRR